MHLTDLLWHALNFMAPAFVLAVLLPLLSRIWVKKPALLVGWKVQMIVNLLVGIGALAGGLWWLGRDGKMGAYALLVVVVATSQWVLVRGWRR